MDQQIIIERVHSLFADAAIDISGEGCEFELKVLSDQFQGMPVVRRQQAILNLFADDLKSGKLHALSVKARTYAEAARSSNNLVQLEM